MKNILAIATVILLSGCSLFGESFQNEDKDFVSIGVGNFTVEGESTSSTSLAFRRYMPYRENIGIGLLLGYAGTNDDVATDNKGVGLGYLELYFGPTLKYDISQDISLFAEVSYDWAILGDYADGTGIGYGAGVLYQFGSRDNLYIGADYKVSNITMTPIKGDDFDVGANKTQIFFGWTH